MRKLLIGLPFYLFLAQAAFGICSDTTVVLTKTAPGFNSTTGVYNPDAANAVNDVISKCTDSTIIVRINLDSSLSASLKDSIKLSNPIKVTGRADKTTFLTTAKKSGIVFNPPLTVTDSIITFTENSGNSSLLTVTALNRTQIDHFGFGRKSAGSVTHSVIIAAKGSRVAHCHFWTADNTTSALGSLLDIQADSVLVERCLFRAPPDGNGNAYAITSHGTGTANKVEIRANVFYSTGLYLTVGSFHIFANTFAGSRNGPRFISIGSGVVNPTSAVNIQYNMFVAKVDSLAPIIFNSTITSSDSILRNAYSRSNGTSLAENASGAALTLNGASALHVNTMLSRGFSNYAPSVPIKSYPLTQLRNDPSLSYNNPKFGTCFSAFNSSWTGVLSVSQGLPDAALYFPNLQPFKEGTAWNNAVKAGAFVPFDDIKIPSPLDSGALGNSLTFIKDTALTNVGMIKVSKMTFDRQYYGATVSPEYLYFFFSDTLSKLTGSNDTTALLASTGRAYLKIPYLTFNLNSTSLTVPNSVRNGKDIYIKMLHFKDSLQAPVLSSSGVIGLISGIPSFPANDLTVTVNASLSDYPAGKVQVEVNKGGEKIDSIRVTADNGAGGLTHMSKQPAGTATTFIFTGLAKGTYTFYATPIGSGKIGAPTPSTAPVTLGAVVGDTVFVIPKSNCPGADGSSFSKAYCVLDTAFKVISAKKTGGVILIKNDASPVSLDAVNFSGPVDDSGLVTITTPPVTGKLEPNRPVFKGSLTKEALVITRKNVLVRGFVIEMPAGSALPAVSIKNSGIQLDGNIFRSASNSQAAEGPAVKIEVGASAKVRLTNNAVWGFNKAVLVANSTSSEIKILNNTFLADVRFPLPGNTVGISQQGGALNAVIANNFFSNIGWPLDSSAIGMKPVLDHNVFTVGQPKLLGQLDAGALDSNDQAGTTDLTVAGYLDKLETALNEAFSCSAVHPCPSLQAASTQSPNGQVYGVNVTTDLFGRPRPAVNKDVGALEVNKDISKVLGRLSVTAREVQDNFAKVSLEIATKNYDSLESDSIYVWWTTTSKAQLKDTPKAQQHGFSMKKLSGGSFSDTAINLKERTLYYFYAAYVRSSPQLFGYAYSDTLTTSIAVETGSCNFALSNTICPSNNGFFQNVGGFYNKLFFTRITMSDSITAPGVVVKNPEFNVIELEKVYSLSLLSPMPKITLDISGTSLGQPGSNLTFQARILLPSKMDLSGKELFLLPSGSGRPTHVSTWYLDQVADSNFLVIEGNTGGTLNYAFGKLADDADPGIIQVTDAAPPTFNYPSAGDSTNHISVNFKGSGFKTTNPLVLVSVVPAGGTATGILSGSYPVKTLVLSSNLTNLQADTRKDRFYKYFQRALGAQTQAALSFNQKSPFKLDSVDSAHFASAVSYASANLEVSPTGDLTQTGIEIPMLQTYKDGEAGRKASRSIEVVFTIFDGSKLVRTSSFIRSHFQEANLQGPDKKLFAANRWNLFGYPWDDADTGSQARVVGKGKWSDAEMRLMKYKGTGKGPSSFIVYDGSAASAVKFDSGQAVWSGSTRAYDPICSDGYSLDYQTFELPLTVGQYTDFSPPFNFPIKMSDIMTASALATMPTMYRYTAGKPGSWEPISATSVLHPWDGLTVKPSTALTLKFPVLDSARSGASGAPKPAAEVENQWTANVRVFNGTAAMSLSIGKSPRGDLFGEPPDVPGQDFRMVLKYFRQDGGVEPMAQFLQSDLTSWQGHWALQGTASTGSAGVTLKVTDNKKGIPLYLVESLHKTALPLTNDSVRISEADLRANDYHLVAGDPQYLADVMDGLSPANVLNLFNYPNPFQGSTQIRYALPASFGKVDFLLKMRDFRGRTVLEKTVKGSSSLNYLWDGKDKLGSPLPAGVYTLVVETKVEGKPSYRATRRVLKL